MCAKKSLVFMLEAFIVKANLVKLVAFWAAN